MSTTRPRSPFRHSLRLRVPIVMSALIAIVVTTFLWVGYRQVESALLQAGGVRAQGAADQLANLLILSAQQRLSDLQRAAGSTAVRTYLQQPTDSAAAAVRQRLTPLATAGQPAIELWDGTGHRLLTVEGPPAPNGAAPPHLPVTEPPSALGASPLQVSGDNVFWDAVAEVRKEAAPDRSAPSSGERLGYLFSRRLLTSATASDVISRLVGGGAVVEIGNQSGGVWTNLSKLVAPPPIETGRPGVVVEYRTAERESRLGTSALIRGTPWAVWVEFPRSVVIAPARTFLTRMLVFGLGFVLVAAILAWRLSARITTPLHDLTRAAEAIAAGKDLEHVDTTRRDEMGRLGAAFHIMARQIQVVQRELEERVQQRMAELADARQELDGFFALSLDMLCIAGADGYFKHLNPAWSATLGWTDSELRGKPYLDFVHPNDRDVTVRVAGELANESTIVTFENRYECRDGSYRWLQWKAISVGARGVIYAAARDITDQKATEAQIRHLNGQLEERVTELNTLTDELEAFSYSVSHDLRAPLRHVTGFAALLTQSTGGRLAEQETRYVTTIVDAATRMGRLIDDLLSFSRMGRAALERRPVSLDALVRDARREVEGTAPSRDILWNIHPLPDVEGDPAMLRLALVNLLSNAIKYSGSRAYPAIEVGANGGNPKETVVYVRDNGVGFDMQYAHKLFGVFQRLHSSDAFEGTGIGLANVRRIVRRHGGRVWAEGVVDEGATFFFALPHQGGVIGDR